MSVPSALAAVVRDELERVGVPGLAVGFLREGSAATAAFGLTSVETGAPVREASAFRIASITKPFTATLAFLLAEEGVLSLDEPVATGEGITLRHLLSHSSGLDCELPGGLDGVTSLQDLDVSAVRRWTPPGELWSYSNAGFWLAGAAIERASGRPFEDAMRDRVLAPLRLDSTTFELEQAILSAPAVGHEAAPEPAAREHTVVRSCYRYARPRRPSGGLISTVADLLAFAQAHFDDRYAPMREPIIDAVGCSWGLGWRVESLGPETAVLHDGSYGGFESQLLLLPERRFAFAALANSTRGSEAIQPVADAALELCCGLRRPRPAPMEPADGALDRFGGRYRQNGLDVVVAPAGATLELRGSAYDVSRAVWDPIAPVRALPVGATTFAVEGSRELFDFPREGLIRVSGRIATRA